MGKEKKIEVRTEVGEGVKNNPTQIWPYLCYVVGFFLTFFPTSSQYATVTSTKNDLQYQKKLGQAK